jgi:hypothetical protein
MGIRVTLDQSPSMLRHNQDKLGASLRRAPFDLTLAPTPRLDVPLQERGGDWHVWWAMDKAECASRRQRGNLFTLVNPLRLWVPTKRSKCQ